LIIDLHIV